jgi:hypothetical protein
LEATAGFEPAIGVLQTPALTTWPRRPGAEGETQTRDPPGSQFSPVQSADN